MTSPRIAQARAKSAFSAPSAAEGPQPFPPLTLETLVARIHDLPAMPSVVLQIMKMTGRGESAPRELAQVISRDPNFAARILKMANSAYYGLPRSVSTLTEAVLMLGNHSIRNLAMVAATQETLCGEVVGYELDPGELWRHSIGCALAASMLAKVTGQHSEEAFVAGLLHDVGKTILGLHVRERIPAIYAYIEREQCAFVEAEHAILGFDHAELGGQVARYWNLPLPLSQAIAWHHEPIQNGRAVPLAALVHMANAVCLMAGIGVGADGLRIRFSVPAMQSLGLTDAHLETALEQLVTEMAEVQPLMNAS